MADIFLRQGEANPDDIRLLTTSSAEVHSGTGTLDLTAALAQTGVKGGLGTGTVVLAAGFSQAGIKNALGTGTLAAAAGFSASGKESAAGTGTLVLIAGFAASGVRQETGDVAQSSPGGGRRSFVRFDIEEHAGTGQIALRPILVGTGSKSFESDDELVLALAA